MKTRIRKFIDHKNISPVELADQIGVQRSNISHILNGRNKPGAAFLEKFLRTFPEVNARWLLTGEGDMLSGEDSGDIIRQNRKDTGPDFQEDGVHSAEEAEVREVRQDPSADRRELFEGTNDLSPGGPVSLPDQGDRHRMHDQEKGSRVPESQAGAESFRHLNDPAAGEQADGGHVPGEVRSEPDVPYGSRPATGLPGYKSKGKSIDKVILLYTDGTFVSYQQE